MKTEMHNEMKDMLVDYQSTYTSQKIQDDVMEELSDQFNNSLRMVKQAKRTLLGVIDGMNMLVIKPW